MPTAMALTPYKPNQGLYARGAAGGALLFLALFSAVRLMLSMEAGTAFELLGLEVPTGAVWSAAVFVVCGLLIAILTFGFETGLAGVDGKVRGVVDLLIDTQGELQKVSWPSKDELRRSTTVVLVCIFVLGAYLFTVDLVVNLFMTRIGVLPG